MLKHCSAIKRSKALGGRSGDAAEGGYRAMYFLPMYHDCACERTNGSVAI
jgi:hypothetical protein